MNESEIRKERAKKLVEFENIRHCIRRGWLKPDEEVVDKLLKKLEEIDRLGRLLNERI